MRCGPTMPAGACKNFNPRSMRYHRVLPGVDDARRSRGRWSHSQVVWHKIFCRGRPGRIQGKGGKTDLGETGDTVPVRSMGIASRAPFPRGRTALLRLLRTLRNDKLPFGGMTLSKKGLFELHISKGLNIVCSSNVGGGSHVYAGLNAPPPEPDYWDGITDELSA